MAGQRSLQSTTRLFAAIIFNLRAILLLLSCLTSSSIAQESSAVPCTDASGRVQRCQPTFVNAAFNVEPEATNTCGERQRVRYCRQTGVTGAQETCDFCVSEEESRRDDSNKAHPAKFLTDFHQEEYMTWWQSETMLEMDISDVDSVNLTISLGKSFEITYIRLKFYSPRPESFAIYKRTTQDGPWIPYQYYSGSCYSTYDLPSEGIVTTDDETKAICTREFSDVSPLTGGNIAFSTLEGRPSAYYFDTSDILQEWVTATDILVMLTRLNTFGDEVFGVADVLRSYYYAITDFSIGGRCKCNGHASECIESSGLDRSQRLICNCQHNTMGQDCEECQPMFNDRPWTRATGNDANECMPCDCNQKSNKCFFDQDLYDRTGHGGHCTECRENTAGANCERCKDLYYRPSPNDQCRPCQCDGTGSLNQQCDSRGLCPCKVGVGGDKCNQCLPNFYEFDITGCRSCECTPEGSINNLPNCNSLSGECDCKANVEGRDCERCKPGYFNLQEDDEFGCLACFCYGHSSVCNSAPGYMTTFVESKFGAGVEGWKAEGRDGAEGLLVPNALRRDIGVAYSDKTEYFVAPVDYLGDKRSSYGQELSFQLRLGSDDTDLGWYDLILEGDGETISTRIDAQGNPAPGTYPQKYTFLLREEEDLTWAQRPTAFTFQRVLSNLTAIKIRATYMDFGQGFLDNVQLSTVQRAVGPGSVEANSVELCTCPEGYVGQYCESCSAGFRRDPPNSSPFAMCVPCQCNNHASYCDPNSGICICQHNTFGENCEFCAPGYYGDATQGTDRDCKPCPCPGQSECILDNFDEVVCTDCPDGYAGNRCDKCADGYFGEADQYGRLLCQKCYCNDNIDSNAIMNCNGTSGECLKCIYNTGGFECERCLEGFYGDAIAFPKGQCQACECSDTGSFGIECDQFSGQCSCLPFVTGRDCNECQTGYWNIDSGSGCQACNCHPEGSTDEQCDLITGQCPCKPGVEGYYCDQCRFDAYGFSSEGCTACECNYQGSKFLNCTEEGVCYCRDGVIGDKCDSCEENHYNIAYGCIPCPACYNLVEDRVNEHRDQLQDLSDLINNIGNNPDLVNDEDFERRLRQLDGELNRTIAEAEGASAEDAGLAKQFSDLKDNLGGLLELLDRIKNNINQSEALSDDGEEYIGDAEEIIERIKRMLENAQAELDDGWRTLKNLNDTARNMTEQALEMQQLAKQARELASGQEDDATRVEGTANEALATSEEALRIANQTGGLGDIEEKIAEVETNYNTAQELFDEVDQIAQDAQTKAQKALDDATDLLGSARGKLPAYDTSELQQQAADIVDRANEIKEEAARVQRENEDLMEQVERDSQEAAELLDQGIKAQQDLDLLLAMANAAEAEAESAKKKGDQTLEEAEDILETLKGFNEQVEASKQLAQNASLKIPGIIAMIEEANETALTAEATIEAAETDALLAREIANEAEANATEASNGASRVKEDAEQTKLEAQRQNDRATDIVNNATETDKNLDALEDQADSDALLAQLAQTKANEAKRKAENAAQAVQDALDAVTRLMMDLQNLGEVDPNKFQEIEEDFGNLQRTFENDLNIDGVMTNLRGNAAEQEVWITNYNMDLDQVRKDVANIRSINETLPDFCPYQDVLERP